ncbi:ribosomal RNA small subunit methyltransferase A [Candidatus Uhrbacteria bacterium]|nr:ribosomal RNA small subunit methyltransferase A [Candidatus Uhrbacteria bacterium]
MTYLPKKSYGQHFLISPSVVSSMVEAADLHSGDTVLEIGPGTGVITKALLETGAKVVAVEADRELMKGLEEVGARGAGGPRGAGEGLKLVGGDIISKKDTLELPVGYKLVSNLPYHIAAHVLRKFLYEEPRPVRMVLMVQREVADRIVAEPGEMGLLSVVCQVAANCRKLVNVPPGAFNPPPKVGSAVVVLDVQTPFPSDAEAVVSLAKAGFSSRRKQLRRNLVDKGVATMEVVDHALAAAGLPLTVRAQELGVAQWRKVLQEIK